DAAPLLRDLFFDREKADFVPALAAHPALHRLDSVRFADCAVPPAAISTFVDSPYVANLRKVWLSESQVRGGPMATAALLRLLGLPKLTPLRLGTPALGDVNVTALAQSPDFSGLRLLSVRGAGITDEGAAALAASPHLALTEGLYLDYNQVSVATARALAG